MRYETLFLALTAGLVNCERSRFDHALAAVEEAFEGLEFRRQRVPGHSSIGARTLKAQSLTLVDWVAELRTQGLLRAGTPGLLPTSARDKISKIQADAFAGGNVRSLVIEFSHGQSLYAMQVENSSPHLMTGALFASWIASQKTADTVWPRVLSEINEFNQMNGLDSVQIEQIESYLASMAGAHVFNVIGDRCLEAAQSASVGAGLDLDVSDENQIYFDRGDREEQIHLMLGGSAEEFLPFEELLQLRGVATGFELVRLFDAQLCRDAVWQQVGEAMMSIAEIEEPMPESLLRQAVQKLAPERIEFFGNSLVTRMQNACRANHQAVQVTPEFQDRLMTHLESLSAEQRACYVPTNMRLHFSPNREPWQHFCFNEMVPTKTSSPVISSKRC